MHTKQKVLIVGGVAGGASTATRLRRLDEHAEIIILERGEYVSFANCGLPYYIGGTIKDKNALTVQKPQDFVEKFNIDVRIFHEVTAIDTEKKVVTIKEVLTGKIYEENYDKLVLSMGASPIQPPIVGSDCQKVFTLRNIPDTYAIKDYIQKQNPKTAVVVGGGFIGVEMAENLHQAGLDVTLVEMANQVIAPIDPDMAADVHHYMKSKGIHLSLENGVTAIEETNTGLHITLTKGTVNADMLIMAIGVRPDTALAKQAGIALNERGAIIVDAHMKTSAKDVYAVGDAIEITDSITEQKGYIPLAGPANKQGRIAADNICGIASTYPGTQGSSILKIFDMIVASTGINEKTAKRLGLCYDKAYTFSGNHADYYPGAVKMAIKTIFDKTNGKILGAQIVGFEGSDKRCDVFSTAIRAGMTAYDLTKLELCYAPPFGSAKDPINMAGFVIENLLTQKVKQIHWHDVQNLPKDDSIIRIDVRTPQEYSVGNIEGFPNLPLSQIREKMKEMDKTKPVYICCQIGLKAYTAARILTQNGFDATIIGGGYRLYHSIFGK